METKSSAPLLFPIEPDKFWNQIRTIIREEINSHGKPTTVDIGVFGTPELTNKPHYKISDVCSFFKVAKPIINDLIRHGKKRHRVKRGSLSQRNFWFFSEGSMKKRNTIAGKSWSYQENL